MRSQNPVIRQLMPTADDGRPGRPNSGDASDHHWSKVTQIGLACFVLLLGFLSGKLAGTLELHVPRPVWALWPGCAILVSVLLLVRRDLWAIVLPAGLAGFVLYDLSAGLGLGSILAFISVDTAEVLTATLGLGIAFKSEPQLDSFRGLAKYFLFAVIAAPFVAATFGATLIHGVYWRSWRIIFLSEALAFLTLPPAILGWADAIRTRRAKGRKYFREIAILLAGVFAFGYVMVVMSGRSITPALFYALVPFLIWSALRFGQFGVSTAILVVACLSIWGAIQGRGPFMGATRLDSVISLQVFLFCAATPFMVLAALAEQHKHAEKNLEQLSGRLIKAQEEERTRIARELHDDLSQTMARLLIRLNRCQTAMEDASPQCRDELAGITEITSAVSASLRDLSHLLHPATLTTLGLVTSIRGFCREFSERHNLVVKFTCRDIPSDTAEDVNLCLFRVVQESLRNVLKHSGAPEAHVDLSGTSSGIELVIEDAGTGFDVKSNQVSTALGLISMKERVRLVGGHIAVESEPWHGTRIRVEIPLAGMAPARA
ncbi:MAG TPA: sensor histidine kinase [Candidatus Sulfotelmatobacter sp.]|nr:sensor histidine kinase [Candidatus Sulfotelmatobacter sp.]